MMTLDTPRSATTVYSFPGRSGADAEIPNTAWGGSASACAVALHQVAAYMRMPRGLLAATGIKLTPKAATAVGVTPGPRHATYTLGLGPVTGDTCQMSNTEDWEVV
jgi:hypothetical protein